MMGQDETRWMKREERVKDRMRTCDENSINETRMIFNSLKLTVFTDLDINASGFFWNKATRQASRRIAVQKPNDPVNWSGLDLQM